LAADLDALRARAAQALTGLRGLGGLSEAGELEQARELVVALCRARLFALTMELAEAVTRQLPRDARTRRIYAQALIEQGCASAAIDMLKPLAARLPAGDPEQAEATGLLGRAWKQIFFDAGEKTGAAAREALRQAIAAYRKAFEQDPARTWHGVNLVALLTRARRLGLRIAPELQPDAVARRVVAALNAVPPEARDEWHLPTLAEASLGLNDWSAVEAALKGYVADDRTAAFTIASTLRQFTQVWDVESVDARGRALADILRARLLEVGGGELSLAPQALQRARERAEGAPPAGQLEAVLGAIGAKTWKWWKTGLERASAICSVRTRVGDRIGTGWLVRAGALNRTPADELLVVTNFHVVNAQGAHNGITPESAEIVFEAVDAGKAYGVQEIVWSSPPERLDCALLRLSEPVAGIVPLPLARVLPLLDPAAHVYVIGHPGGRDLAFSLQDNALLDHEGPPAGRPAIEGVCRVHYRAPTEGGSSGSPVFNASLWEVIALHHSGGKLGMPKLNGQAGSYGANEGIWVQSIVAAQGAPG
jgi:hypothetical protein